MLEEASGAYEEGLKKFPEDAALKKGMDDVRAAGSKRGANQITDMFNKPEVMAKLWANPETKPLMEDEQFMATFNMAKANPQLFTQMMQSDPRFMTLLQIGLGLTVANEDGTPMQPPQQEASKKAKPEPKKEPVKELTEEEKAAKAVRDEADVFKEQGTTAYKAKDFPTAIGHYTKAFEIDPSNMAYLTNRAACHFEAKDYTECIKDCEEAIKTGKENHSDFKVIGRAYARIGNSYRRQVKAAEGVEAKTAILDMAIEAYNKSLMEHRTDAVWTDLKKAQKEKKEAVEGAYVDPSKAAAEKETGNAFFKEGKWVDALRHYGEAIKRDPKNPETTHIYYSNRGNCYIRLNEMNLAIEDFDKCIGLNPTYVKAYLNKAHIKFAQKEYQKVMPIYQAVIDMEEADDASKEKAKQGLQKTMQAVQSMQGEGASEEQLRRAQADPEIQQILGDPMVQQVLRDFKDNPSYAQKALKDPVMAPKINKLVAAGVIRFG